MQFSRKCSQPCLTLCWGPFCHGFLPPAWGPLSSYPDKCLGLRTRNSRVTFLLRGVFITRDTGAEASEKERHEVSELIVKP